MLAERALTTVMRKLSRGYATHEPTGIESIPRPVAGRRYVLYAHVPFCERLCTYCSFNRFLFKEELARPYFHRLREEMRLVADLGYDFDSLYVGGGTPTVLLDELCSTIDLARKLFHIREVSSETSPNHLLPEVAERLGGRVQRMSVGVQSFDDRLLKIMDRYDKYGSGESLRESITRARGWFPALNVDMIFNFPSQNERMLLHDVDMLEQTGCTQATFYPLMAGPSAARALAETVGRIDFVRESEYYAVLDGRLRQSFQPASAWSYTKDKSGMIDEYIVDYDEYVGIGSGALSFVEGRVYCNTFSLAEYAERIDAGRLSVNSAGKSYDRRALMRYRMASDLFGLRLDKRRFQAIFGSPIEWALAPEITFLRAAGAFDQDDEEAFTLTPRGRYLMVVMMREILSNSNELRDEARAALPLEERMMLLEGTAFAQACAAEPECATA
jgi:coproporphyrinogen III oxidase-like Fe-S oxidoreductase